MCLLWIQLNEWIHVISELIIIYKFTINHNLIELFEVLLDFEQGKIYKFNYLTATELVQSGRVFKGWVFESQPKHTLVRSWQPHC